MSTNDLASTIRAFYLERVSALMRHEDVAARIPDYDINNAYQYMIAREQAHLAWLQRALVDLGAAIPADPARVAVPAVKGDGWKALAAEDARANAQCVDAWRQKVEDATHVRHKKMLRVILGELLEHKRLMDQAAAGRTDLIGTSLAINDHPGAVIDTRWVE